MVLLALAVLCVVALGERRRILDLAILADVRLHPSDPRWAHRLPRDRSTYAMLEREFRREGVALWAASVLLAKAEHPDGFNALRRLAEDARLSPHARRVAAEQLPRVRHPEADRYVELLLDNTPDDRMRRSVLGGFWSAGRAEESVGLLLRTAPKMRDPASISGALTWVALTAPSPRLLPLVLRYAQHDSSTVRRAAIAAGHSLFWDTTQLQESEYAQIVEMWRRATRDQDPSVAVPAEAYIHAMEQVGLPRKPRYP